MNKLRGPVEMTFVMGGLSKEKNKPYLQVSNGIEAKFLRLSKTFEVDSQTFSAYEKGDVIVVDIETDGIDCVALNVDSE